MRILNSRVDRRIHPERFLDDGVKIVAPLDCFSSKLCASVRRLHEFFTEAILDFGETNQKASGER